MRNAADVSGAATEQASVPASIEAFASTAGQLSNSFQLLQSRVTRLSRELKEVSAQKEQELEKKNLLANRLQTLLEFLPGGVIVLDAKGFVTQVNPVAREMLNHPLEGYVWRDIISLCFAPESGDRYEISTVEGRRISLATASLADSGQIILLTDQTETHRLQQQVNRSERLSAMGRMVSALAHQIRTPLSAAILYANHLQNDTLSPKQSQQFAHKLLGRLNHMERQVRDMLLFVRNELPLNDSVSLGDLELGLRAAMEVPLATAKGKCLWQNPNPGVRLRCNREALIGAVLNLVNNALQANPKAAKLKVSFVKTALNGCSAIALAVADNGPGMNRAELAQSQEVFYTTKPQGTGLGLAVVQSVVRAHGGVFRLQSVKDKGTCATLIIPIEQA